MCWNACFRAPPVEKPPPGQVGPQPGGPPGAPPPGEKEACKRASGLNFKLNQQIFDGEVAKDVRITTSLKGQNGVKLADVAAQIQCSLNGLRDVVLEYIRGRTSTAINLSEVELLAKQVSVGISNLIWDDEKAIKALAGTAIMNLREETEITTAIVDYILTYIGKSSTALDYVISEGLANGVSKEEIKQDLAEVFVTVGTPDTTALEKLIKAAVGEAAEGPEESLWELFRGLITADVLLKRGSLTKLQRLAEELNADMDEFIDLLSRIVATELNIDYSDAERLVDLVITIPGPDQISDVEVVSMIVLDLATEDKSLIGALARLTAGSFRREKTVEQALTGIVSQFVEEERPATGQPAFGFGIFGTGLTLVDTLRSIDVAATLDNLILAENLRSEPGGDSAQEARDKAKEDTANKDNLLGSVTSGTGLSKLELFDFSESRTTGTQGTDPSTLAAAFQFAQSREEPGGINPITKPMRQEPERESLAGAASGLPEEKDRASDIEAGIEDNLVLGNRFRG